MTDRIQYCEDGDLDEVVFEHCDVHVERMDKGVFWMALRKGDGSKEVIVWLTSRGKIKGRIE